MPLLNDTVNSFEFSDTFVQVAYACYIVKTMPVRVVLERAAEGRCLPVRCYAILADTARVFSLDTTKPHISEVFGSYG